MSRRLSTVLRLAVGILALGLLLWRVDVSEAREALRGAHVPWLGAALLAQLGSKTCWILRWDALLTPSGNRRPFLELLRYVLIGLFFNNFLPTSVGGDVVRGVELSRSGVPRPVAGASVVGDRVVGLLALALMAAVGGALGVLWWPGQGPWATAGLFAVGVALLIAGISRPEFLGRLASSRMLAAGRIARKVGRLLESVTSLAGRGGTLLRALAYSTGLSAFSALYHWTIGRALDIQVPLAAYFVIIPAVMLFAALPITLNGLGLRELGFVGFLGTQGVPTATAAVFAFLAFFGTLGFAIAGGLLFLTGDRSPRALEGEST